MKVAKEQDSSVGEPGLEPGLQGVGFTVTFFGFFPRPPAVRGSRGGQRLGAGRGRELIPELCSLDPLIKERSQSSSACARCFRTPAGSSPGKFNMRER